MDANLSAHFKVREMCCPCCKAIDYKNISKLVRVLEELRANLSDLRGKDTPIVISSGHRCPPYNKKKQGSPTSYHMRSLAADIWVPTMSPYDVLMQIEDLAPYQTGGGVKIILGNSWFIHMDLRKEMWREAKIKGELLAYEDALVYLGRLNHIRLGRAES